MSLSVSPTSGFTADDPPNYGGVYPAKVYSIADPSATKCVQLYIPQVFGTAPVKIWAPPCVPGGAVPPVGTVVWCLFQGGDPSYPVYLPELNSFPGDVVAGGNLVGAGLKITTPAVVGAPGTQHAYLSVTVGGVLYKIPLYQ